MLNNNPFVFKLLNSSSDLYLSFFLKKLNIRSVGFFQFTYSPNVMKTLGCVGRTNHV